MFKKMKQSRSEKQMRQQQKDKSNIEEVKTQSREISAQERAKIEAEEKREEIRRRKAEESSKLRAQRQENDTNISGLEFFIENILNKVTKGELDLQGSQFEISYSRIMSELHKKRVFYIQRFPITIRAGHLEYLRTRTMAQIPFEERKDITINIFEHHTPENYNFSVHSRKLATMEKNFRRQRVELVEEKLDKEANIQGAGINYTRDTIQFLEERIKKVDRKIDSFDYVDKHQKSGGSTTKAYYFVEVTGRTLAQVDRVAEIVSGLLDSSNYEYSELTEELSAYLKNFGLANLNYGMAAEGLDIPPMTITSDVSSITQSYTEGIVRSEHGDIYLGHSLNTLYPVDVSFSESDEAANILIVADSGSGKTVFSKILSLGMLTHAGGSYNIIVNDYKGREWDNMLIKSGAIVSMGIDNPRFINTARIPDHKIYGFRNPETSYNLSSNFTEKTLAILTGVEDPTMLSRVSNVCSDIIQQMYLSAGVNKKLPETYVKAKDIDFRGDIWNAIQEVTNSSVDMERRHTKEVLSLVKINLEPYFTLNGSKSYIFENGVDIDEIMTSKMVIFDYGTQTDAGDSIMLEKEINMRIYQKDFFTTLYTSKNKLNKQYTVEIDEEVQRQLNSPIMRKMLNDKITGGRSSNKINILITNTATGLLDSTDMDIAAIRENINSVLIGRCKLTVAREVLKYFSLERADSLAEKVTSAQGKFKNSFLCAINTGNMFKITVTKMMIPNKILQSDLLKSKDIESSNKTSIL